MLMKNIDQKVIMLVIVLFGLNAVCDAQVIPAPQNMSRNQGTFTMNAQTTWYTNLNGKEKKLMTMYMATLPFRLVEGKASDKSNALRLVVASLQSKHKEAYVLNVTPETVEIKANTGAGLFYGMQTLWQLSSSASTLNVPCVEVIDEPRFDYRGFMLDVSRHFFSKEFVYKQLDLLAHYKINTFHFHLVDGGGWRIEMKKYPQLTEMTAYRPNENWSEFWNGGREFCSKNAPHAYGGYYTQQDIRDIVRYAAVRHITVIPEIDLPGHSNEVLLALPQLACEGHDYRTSFELCIGKEETFRFCENVLKEIMDLFPSEYIHIGGDEANRDRWNACPDCKKRMADEHIADVAELQSYFTRRIEKFVNRHGRKIIGWDEILDGPVSKSATIMAWREESGSMTKATEQGHHVVMTPRGHCYIDYLQTESSTQPRYAEGYLPLSEAYEFEPVPAGTKNPALVWGVQGNLWTEYIATDSYAEYMTYPRMMALAEVGWTKPEHKSFSDFYRRMLHAQQAMKDKGYNSYNIDDDLRKKQTETWKAKHVILIGIDGWAAASMAKADMPTVKNMMRNGSYTLKKRSVLPSASAINWASMMMGAGTEMTGYTKWNTRIPEIPSFVVNTHHIFPTIFSVLREQFPSAKTAALFDWDGIKYVIDTLAIDDVMWKDQAGYGKENGEGFGDPLDYVKIAENYIKKERPTFFFTYFGGLDETGHLHGWYTDRYYAFETKLDQCIARIVQATKDAGIYEDTVFILSSDHGGIDKGHGGITLEEMESPFIAFGKNVRPMGAFDETMMQFDIAATIAYIFGLDTPQAWIGRPMKQLFR